MKIKHNNKIYDVLAKNTISNGTSYYTFQNDQEKYVTVPNAEVIDDSPIDNTIVADKLKDVELSIKANRYCLSNLYDIKNKLTTQCTAGEFEFGKLYKFYNICGEKWVDNETEYYGIIKAFDIKDEEFIVYYSGIYNDLVHTAQDFADCQIGGFDANGTLGMSPGSIDAFIKNCVHISEEEYNAAVEKLCNDIQERSKYWTKKFTKN